MTKTIISRLSKLVGLSLLLLAMTDYAIADYSTESLIGRWFSELAIQETEKNSAIRICLSEENFVNKMTQYRGEVLVSDRETSSSFGAKGKIKIISQEKWELVGDRVVNTTISGRSELVEFSISQNGEEKKREQLDEAGKQAFDEIYASYKKYADEYVEIGEIWESRILSLTPDKITSEVVDYQGDKHVVDSIRTNKIISECPVQ
jgi:hypothetical protein